MNSPSHDDVARCAQELWQNYGRPTGRDLEIWLEAEKKLATPATPPTAEAANSNSTPTQERLKAEMAAESETEFYLTQPVSEQTAIRAALQTKESRTARPAPVPVRKGGKVAKTV
jgi:hypothetical protein